MSSSSLRVKVGGLPSLAWIFLTEGAFAADVLYSRGGEGGETVDGLEASGADRAGGAATQGEGEGGEGGKGRLQHLPEH